jgi:adenylyltransferase/sulfurtransferase
VNPTVRELIDYEAFCGIGASATDHGATLSVQALAEELEGEAPPQVVDVREPHELAIAALPGATHIPLGELPGRLGELDSRRPIVTVCHRGVRSLRAAEVLGAAGFARVRSLEGGIDAWAAERDPEMARY